MTDDFIQCQVYKAFLKYIFIICYNSKPLWNASDIITSGSFDKFSKTILIGAQIFIEWTSFLFRA